MGKTKIGYLVVIDKRTGREGHRAYVEFDCSVSKAEKRFGRAFAQSAGLKMKHVKIKIVDVRKKGKP